MIEYIHVRCILIHILKWVSAAIRVSATIGVFAAIGVLLKYSKYLLNWCETFTQAVGCSYNVHGYYINHYAT